MRSKTKVMLLAFFDSEGIVHHEYAPDRQTINKDCRFVPYTENNMFYFPASALIITLCNNT